MKRIIKTIDNIETWYYKQVYRRGKKLDAIGIIAIITTCIIIGIFFPHILGGYAISRWIILTTFAVLCIGVGLIHLGGCIPSYIAYITSILIGHILDINNIIDTIIGGIVK